MSHGLVNPHMDFKDVALEFIGDPYEDIFGLKNNKTVAETIKHRRYIKLAPEVTAQHPHILDRPLGTELLRLKREGDHLYRRFLNRYGDLRYRTFRLSGSKFAESTGVYAYFEDDALMYIGQCRDSMKKRIDQGYGKIHPKNCYLDGQATNCRINAKIAGITGAVSLRLYALANGPDITSLEATLIRKYSPPWNIQAPLGWPTQPPYFK